MRQRLWILTALLWTVAFSACTAPSGGGYVGGAAANGASDAADAGGAGADAGGGNGPAIDLVTKPGHSAPGQSWTVLVYMAADNDLETFAVQDLLEMAQVGSGPGFNLIVQVDRAAGHSAEGVGSLGDFVTTKRVKVTKGGFEQLADLGERDRTDPSALADFLAWGLSTYPADHAGLVLWNHGAGVQGFATDDSAAEGKTMSLPDIAKALKSGLAQAGRDRLDLIGFDACLMASFEVAATVAPYAEYLLASEELEPGHGWDWQSMQALRDKPSLSVPALGKRIGDDFLAYGVSAGTAHEITLSLVDLTLLGDVASGVDAVAHAIVAKLPGATVAVGKSVAQSWEFGRNGPGEPGMNAYDLGQLASALESHGAIDGAARAALHNGLAAAVVYKIAGPPLKSTTGLTLTFPKNADQAKALTGTPGLGAWWQMLQAYWGGGKQAGVPLFANKDGIATTAWLGDVLAFEGSLQAGGGAAVVDATAYGGIVDLQSQTAYVLVEWPATLQGDKVSATWNGTYLKATDGKTAAPIFTSVIALDGGGSLLEAPLLRQDGADTDVVLLRVYLDANGNIVHQALYLFDDAGVGEYQPPPGTLVQPLLLAIQDDETVDLVPTSEVGLDASKLVLATDNFQPGVTLVVALNVEGASGATDGVAAAVPLQSGGGGSPVCGNGQCEAGESAQSCVADCGCKSNAACGAGKVCSAGACVSDPNSCVGRCGDYDASAACQCDAECGDNGDCCADIDVACP